MDGEYVTHVLPVMVLLGAGAGPCFPALMTPAMSGTTHNDAGLASGLVNTTVQVGGALGLAVLATLASSGTTSCAAPGTPATAALNGSYRLAYLIGAAVVLAAIAIALTVLQPEHKAARARQRELARAAPAYGEAA